MKVVKFLVIPAMLLMSHVVLAATPIFGSTSESKYARQLVPPKNKAIVYIYQRGGDGAGVSPTIRINNYEIGRLVPGSFTVWKLSPGKLKIGVGGTNPTSVSIISQAGKVYLFRLSVVQTSAGTRAQLTGLPGSFRSDLATTRLIKNPRAVTSLAVRVPAKPKKPVKTKKPVKPAKRAAQAKPVEEPRSAPRFDFSSDQASQSDVAIAPGGIGLMLKIGALTLSEDTQTILGTARQFDDSVSGLYAIEAYYQLDSGITFGGEILGYTAGFTTAGVDKQDIDVTILFANVKNYFRVNASLQPFIGAGIGAATTDIRPASTNISGLALSGSTAGIAYQLMAGIEYRGTNVGVFGEFKYVAADTESDNNESIDVSGTGIFAGVSFHF